MTDNWLVWALLSAAFAAATAILSKLGLRNVDPDAAQLARTLVVVAALGVAILVAGKTQAFAEFTRQSWLFLVLAGLATAASWACYFRALQAGDAARVAAVDKLSVVMVALFAVVALSERLSPLGWLGVAFAGTGAVLLSIAK
ncbi:EamA family transporter [Lacipirellula limnantheis]|uniref:EamA-like transporter family protein n=1 Tax=Lacipirellula limnantheis TaxID=2528024 RepID=A0A517TVX0_9BACT|nr:EamA family transporter [Lacipirellula limnantheis]QDT72525.1 EamA-like transporter family protein [Lacipirellula limnantheis]